MKQIVHRLVTVANFSRGFLNGMIGSITWDGFNIVAIFMRICFTMRKIYKVHDEDPVRYE